MYKNILKYNVDCTLSIKIVQAGNSLVYYNTSLHDKRLVRLMKDYKFKSCMIFFACFDSSFNQICKLFCCISVKYT